MSLFKNFNIWLFKKHSVEKRNDEETRSEPIIIPEPTIETKDYVTKYHGNPLNIEILKVINEVFAKDYHVCKPWRHPYTNKIPDKNDVGVPYMIEVLDDVLKYCDANPDRTLLLFSY